MRDDKKPWATKSNPHGKVKGPIMELYTCGPYSVLARSKEEAIEKIKDIIDVSRQEHKENLCPDCGQPYDLETKLEEIKKYCKAILKY